MYNNKNNRKHYVSPLRQRRLKHRKRHMLTIALVSVICCIISGVTLAYVFTHTDPIENIFDNAYVACEVLENGADDNIPFDGETKSDVRIKNTGDVQSYIRVAVVVTWMSEDQTKVTATKPVDDSDYVITYADETGTTTYWEKGTDGYWYYIMPVDVGDETENLIESCSLKDGVTAPDGFYLSVEIVASSIQSTPTNVVKEQWDSGVDNIDGTTLVIKQ